VIGILMGDPNGIGIEVILKTLQQRGGGYTLLGARTAFAYYQRRYGFADITAQNRFIDIGVSYQPAPGQQDPEAGRVAIATLEMGIELIKRGTLKALVTAPLAKRTVKEVLPDFIGHTEYLAHRFGIEEVAMLGVRGELRIMFYTTHIPLRDVFQTLDPDRIARRIEMLNRVLEDWFGISTPRILVAGINPHTDEFSRGEEEIIRSGLRIAQKHGIIVEGPIPADTIFTQPADGYLALYHDQGMIPLKSRPGGSNLTTGLPFLRASPLHGTGFDIAGKNRADPTSMIETLNLVEELYDRV